MRRNDEELDKMRKAGKVVAEMHAATRAAAPLGPRNTIGQSIWPPDI